MSLTIVGSSEQIDRLRIWAPRPEFLFEMRLDRREKLEEESEEPTLPLFERCCYKRVFSLVSNRLVELLLALGLLTLWDCRNVPKFVSLVSLASEILFVGSDPPASLLVPLTADRLFYEIVPPLLSMSLFLSCSACRRNSAMVSVEAALFD